MIRQNLRLTLIIVLIAFVAATARALQHEPKSGSAQSDIKKAFNAATKKAKLPKEVHDALSAFVGEFDTASEVQLAPPPAEPLKARGITKAKWIMGGLFVQAGSSEAKDEELKGDRIIIYGYDPGAQKYTMWQIESGNPLATSAIGDYDANSRTFSFEGEKDMGPVKKAPVTWTIHVEDDGTLKQVIKIKSPSGPDREFVRVTHTPKSKS